jgi:hypothetical protein
VSPALYFEWRALPCHDRIGISCGLYIDCNKGTRPITVLSASFTSLTAGERGPEVLRRGRPDHSYFGIALEVRLRALQVFAYKRSATSSASTRIQERSAWRSWQRVELFDRIHPKSLLTSFSTHGTGSLARSRTYLVHQVTAPSCCGPRTARGLGLVSG